MSNSLLLSDTFINSYKDKTVPWGYGGLGFVVYKRTYSRTKDNGKQEEWYETVARCINGAQKIGAQYTKEEMERLYDHIFHLRCNFAGRMLWQLGTNIVERYAANALLNCWMTTICKPDDFCFLFENLMMGGGVGFSVRREDVHELPKVKKDVKIVHLNSKDADFIVPDSRGGWVSLLRKVLDSWFVTGNSFSYSTILVRSAGETIKGFGGTASGPVILVDGIAKICQVLAAREGKKLRSIDVLDICNIIGSIVVAGNLRRSAEIALGDPDDILFLRAKRWDLGNIPNERSMSNNTIYADEYSHIMNEVWEGYNGNGEPYGFFNLPLSQSHGRLKDGKLKKEDNAVGMNPCQPAWATILTPSGISTIGMVKIGDKIWSEGGWTTVVDKRSTGVKSVYRYRTTAGMFYGTEDHRIVSGGIKVQAKEAESIDQLVGQYQTNFKLSSQDIMDGIVFGDGTVHKASGDLVNLCIGSDDNDYHTSEISKLIAEYRPGVGPYAWEVYTTIDSTELPLTYLRSIPDRFVFGKPSKVAAFLRGLFTANGSLCGGRITLKASSFKVIEQVQLMLSSLGISSYYTTNRPTQVTFDNGDYLCKESYDLNITGDRIKFAAIVGFIQQYKTEKLADLIRTTGKSKKHKKSYDIVEVTPISEEEVFDITVDGEAHTYWSGGLNVSNCGEIPLANKECCDLAELYLNNIESSNQLIDCAKLLYKTQKAILALPFLHEETNKIVHKNMRLGLGVTGVCQSLHKLEWLDECYKELRQFDKEWSKKRDWPESIKLTTTKPSGTLSLLAGATPGIHPGFASFYIRRVRMSSLDKLVSFCRNQGYHVEYERNQDGTEKHDTMVVEFPCESGKDAIIAKDMSAIRQLELVKQIQTIWSDNAVSVTVYYQKEELPAIKEWLKKNYKENIKSVSFLLHSDHNFVQAPYQEITEEQYKEAIGKIKKVKSVDDLAGGGLDVEDCVGGSCPIK